MVWGDSGERCCKVRLITWFQDIHTQSQNMQFKYTIPIFSWLRRRWNSSPTVIAGAEDEEYRLILDDIDSSLVFMYTPVTEEGAKGEPQYKYTDFVKAGV